MRLIIYKYVTIIKDKEKLIITRVYLDKIVNKKDCDKIIEDSKILLKADYAGSIVK